MRIKGEDFIDGMHLIRTVQGEKHGLKIRVRPIEREVANWLGRLFFSEGLREPVEYILKINGFEPKKQKRRVRVKREAPWSGGKSFMIVVAPHDTELQYECELECPSEEHARLTMARAGFYESEQLSEVETMRPVLSVKEVSEKQRQPTKKELRAYEEAARVIEVLCTPENLELLCFEAGTKAMEQGDSMMSKISLVELFNLASRMYGRTLGNQAWLLLVNRLEEMGIIDIRQSEIPVDGVGGYAVPRSRFLELGKQVALRKDIAHCTRAIATFEQRLVAAQRKLKKAKADMEEADRDIAEITHDLAIARESLQNLERMKAGEQE